MSDIDALFTPRPLGQRLAETVRHYYDLGFTAFGGPGVHVVILRRRFVDRLGWVDATTFADLFSLGNALPGPGSTQLAFSIATVRNGSLAGLLAFFLWSLPASCGMAGLAAGIKRLPSALPDAVLAMLTGLNAASVGLIALAAYQLSSAAVTDKPTRLAVFFSAAFGICYHAPWMYPLLMASGGALTLVSDQRRAIASFAKRAATRAGASSAARRERAAQKRRAAQAAAERQEQENSTASWAETEAGIPLQALPQRPEPAAAAQHSRSESPEPRKETYRTDDKPQAAAAAGLRQRTQAAEPASASASAGPSRAPSLAASASVRSSPAAVPAEAAPAGADGSSGAQQAPLMVLGARASAFLFASFVVLLVVALSVRGGLERGGHAVSRAFSLFDNLLVAGTIIFGGGPVVVPLLRGYVVDPGWVSNRDFLLGFAILQAFPGPNFAFACYLGLLSLPSRPALGAVLGYLGIFTPGIMLKLALLPLYNKWRRNAIAKSVLRGLNAAAAGLVYTAVWQLFLVGYIYTPASAGPADVPRAQSVSGPLTADPWWAVVAAGSFVATQSFGVVPALSVLLGGVAGLAWYGVTHR